VVRTGFAAGTYDAVLLSTDLEPDDVAAIKVLAPRWRGVPMLVVVGEGDTDGKVEMMAQMLASYGIGASATVVQGQASKEAYPAAALAAFAPAGGACGSSVAEPVRSAPGAGATALSEAFLRQHAAPLAVILKPPHEFLGVPPDALGRAVAVAYGSFNFVTLRDVMRRDDPSLDAAGAARRQEALATGFKRFLWVERSMSVGRDAELSRGHALWPRLATDAGLMAVTCAWNRRVLNSFAKKIDGMGPDLVATCEAAEEPFDAVGTMLEGLSKRVAIMSLIAKNQLQQMPLADPLVAAILLDDAGALTQFQVPCRVTVGTDGRPASTPDDMSSVALLLAGASQQEVISSTLAVLEAALPP